MSSGYSESNDRCAFLFPGQGTQRVGMGQWMFRSSSAASAILAAAASRVPFDLVRLIERGPKDQLTATEHAQVAVFVVNAAATATARERGVAPIVVAGHSVGELNALVASGALEFESALDAVVARGRLFASVPSIGSMVGVSGLTRLELEEVCAEACPGREAVVGLDNAPDMAVISGERSAVDRCVERALVRGASKATRLVTSNGFHSPLMADVMDQWAAVVHALPIVDASIPVVLNTTASPAHAAADLRRALIDQVVSAVNWRRSIEQIAALGVDRLIECGDSSTLTLFCRKILPDMPCTSMHTRGCLAELHLLAAA